MHLWETDWSGCGGRQYGLLEQMMKKKRLDFRDLYRDDVFALLCVFSFSVSIIVGTESMAGLVLTLALDVLALGRGVLALMGKCRPVPANIRRVLEGLMIVVFAGTWVFLGFRSSLEDNAVSGWVWTAALFFTVLAVMYFVGNVYDRTKRK